MRTVGVTGGLEATGHARASEWNNKDSAGCGVDAVGLYHHGLKVGGVLGGRVTRRLVLEPKLCGGGNTWPGPAMMKTRERGVAGGVKEMMGTLGEEGEGRGRCMRACMHACMHARTHARAHARTHACTHT